MSIKDSINFINTQHKSNTQQTKPSTSSKRNLISNETRNCIRVCLYKFSTSFSRYRHLRRIVQRILLHRRCFRSERNFFQDNLFYITIHHYHFRVLGRNKTLVLLRTHLDLPLEHTDRLCIRRTICNIYSS